MATSTKTYQTHASPYSVDPDAHKIVIVALNRRISEAYLECEVCSWTGTAKLDLQ